MNYEPTNWQSGDTVTAEKLNHIEQGIVGGGGVVVTAEYRQGEITYDVTAEEAYEALKSGKRVVVKYATVNISDESLTVRSIATPVFFTFTPGANEVAYFVSPTITSDANISFYIYVGSDGLSWGNTLSKFSPAMILNYSELYGGKVIMRDKNDNTFELRTINEVVPFGNLMEPLMQAAILGAENAKTSYSAVFSEDSTADTLYGLLETTADWMNLGRNTTVSYELGDYYGMLTCTSMSANSNELYASFSGFLPGGVDGSGSSISNIALYPVTVDLYAREYESNGETVHTAEGTVCVEKITSTIVPMS